MTEIVRWGILGAAKIAVQKVIPAMQQGRHSQITAIASRQGERAAAAAAEAGVEKWYGNYEDLLADPGIDAIYIPLPNHLHVQWTRRCLEAGKHVLCEKPLALNVEEVHQLIALRDKTGLQVGEAFMVHTHPQWRTAVDMIRRGELGRLAAMQCFFSYHLTDPGNVRNAFAEGGGGLWDIGCYPIHIARWAFGREPQRVMALIEHDPSFNVDRLCSAILDFESGQAAFTVGTQLVRHQRLHFYGDQRKLEIEIPFNAPPDRPCRIFLDDGELYGAGRKRTELPVCDQYTIQGDEFSRAILGLRSGVPVPLENTLGNTAVIQALFTSATSGNWEIPAI